jgi:hypothetical protein
MTEDSQVDSNMNFADAVEGHLVVGDLAAYLEGKLDDERVGQVESHLSACHACRSELTSAARALREVRRAKRKGMRWPAVAAAAAIVLLLGAAVVADRIGEDAGVFRGDGGSSQTEGVPLLQPVQPISGSLVARDSLRFEWHSLGGADGFYTFTLTDMDGDVLWRGTTRDTFLSLLDEVALEGGSTHFWYVDALLNGAASATTGIQEFRTKP